MTNNQILIKTIYCVRGQYVCSFGITKAIDDLVESIMDMMYDTDLDKETVKGIVDYLKENVYADVDNKYIEMLEDTLLADLEVLALCSVAADKENS